MNFFKRIKSDLLDSRNNHGHRDKVIVDSRSIRELLEHFEALDATERAMHTDSGNLEIEHQLHNLIEAVYFRQGKNAETTLMLIMDTLRPLMEERHKKRETSYMVGSNPVKL